MLFDPNKGFGSQSGDPPAFVEALATFKPDNKRILEYNIASDSVRVRSTPRMLQGKEVEYTDQGPKIVDKILILENEGGGRPSKHPLSNVTAGDEVVENGVAAEPVRKSITAKPSGKTTADEATTDEQVDDNITVQQPRGKARESPLSSDVDVKKETEEADVRAEPATTTAVEKVDEDEEDTMVKRLRGRKRKSSEIAKQAANDAAVKKARVAESVRKDSVVGANLGQNDGEVKVKRPRGRPRKHPLPASEMASGVAAKEGVATRSTSKDNSVGENGVVQVGESRGRKRKSSARDEGASMSASSIDVASGSTNKDDSIGELGLGQDGEPQGKKRKVVKQESE